MDNNLPPVRGTNSRLHVTKVGRFGVRCGGCRGKIVVVCSESCPLIRVTQGDVLWELGIVFQADAVALLRRLCSITWRSERNSISLWSLAPWAHCLLSFFLLLCHLLYSDQFWWVLKIQFSGWEFQRIILSVQWRGIEEIVYYMINSGFKVLSRYFQAVIDVIPLFTACYYPSPLQWFLCGWSLFCHVELSFFTRGFHREGAYWSSKSIYT